MFLGAGPEPQETGRQEGPHPWGSGMGCQSRSGVGPRALWGQGVTNRGAGTVVTPSHLGLRSCCHGPGPAHSPTQARSGEAGRVQSCLPGVTLVLSPQGKRYKNSLETVGTPDSGRGRSEKKAIK